MKHHPHRLGRRAGLFALALAACLALGGTETASARGYDRAAESEEAYTRLFGESGLPGAADDPELFDVMKRFVCGDIERQTQKLSEKERRLVTVAVLAANGHEKLLRANAAASLRVGVAPLELREAVYQVAPYIGFGRAFEALEAVDAVFRENGVALPLAPQGTVTEADRFEKGLAVRKGIYGARIDRARADAPPDMAHIQDDLSAFCFGDTYTRGTLDLKTRELLVVAVLAALGTEPQLKGHVAGSLAVGSDREIVVAAITAALPYIGFPRTLNALRCVNEATDAAR